MNGNANGWEDLLGKALKCWRNMELKAEPLENLVKMTEDIFSQEDGNVDELLIAHNVRYFK